jgi:hypothetical protein
MCVEAIEREAVRQGPAQLAQSLERAFPLSITTYLELASPGDSDFDLVALLEIKRLDNRGWQPDR